jgi:hypothetical protein
VHSIGAPLWSQKVRSANLYYRLIRMSGSDLAVGIVVKSRYIVGVVRSEALYIVYACSLCFIFMCILWNVSSYSSVASLLSTRSHTDSAHLYLYPVTAGSLMCG